MLAVDAPESDRDARRSLSARISKSLVGIAVYKHEAAV